MAQQVRDALQFLHYHHVGEFPRECLQWIITTVSTGGLNGLKENKFKALGCIFTILAWALGRLAEEEDPQPEPSPDDRPDDGVIFGNAEDQTLVEECCKVLDCCPDCDCRQVAAGIGGGFLMRQLINLAISYLVAMLKDADKVEDLLEEIMEWIDEQLKK